MNSRETTRYIMIHMTGTPDDEDPTMGELHLLHVNRGIRSDRGTRTGWHRVIHRAGDLSLGRDLDEVGAHARGYNHNSVAIALAGTFTFTAGQMATLEDQTRFLIYAYPHAIVCGHNQTAHLRCPGFDVEAWAKDKDFPT